MGGYDGGVIGDENGRREVGVMAGEEDERGMPVLKKKVCHDVKLPSFMRRPL